MVKDERGSWVQGEGLIKIIVSFGPVCTKVFEISKRRVGKRAARVKSQGILSGGIRPCECGLIARA